MKHSLLFFIRFILVGFFLFILSSSAFAGVDPTLQKAIDLTYNAQFDEAHKIVNSYIASHPSDPLGYIVRGTSLEWQRKILDLSRTLDDKILEDYKHANRLAFLQWEKDENDVNNMINLGNSYLFIAKKWIDMGKKVRAGLVLKKCKKHMYEAIEKDPNRYDAYVALGIFNFYAGNLPSGLKFLASLLGISGDENTGLKQLHQAATHPNILQSDALFVIAHAYGDTKKNYPMAKKYLDQLISQYPNNPYFRYYFGEAAVNAKKYEEGRSNFDSYFNFCETHQNACAQRFLFYSNYYMAASYINQKNYLPAKPYVQEMEKLDNGYNEELAVGIHYYKGLIAKAEGNRKKALKEFKIVEENKSKNLGAWELSQKELQDL